MIDSSDLTTVGVCIDRVLMLLDNHREYAFTQLFPGTQLHKERYRNEWYSRYINGGFLAVWCHLDEDYRHRLLRLAYEFYDRAGIRATGTARQTPDWPDRRR